MNANKLFKKWYDGLSKDRFFMVRDDIIERCYISRAVFYNWYSGKTPIPQLAQQAIEEYAGMKIFKKKIKAPRNAH